jgi:hypothetical protein
VLCRFEFGWGPWGDLNMARVCDWQFELSVEGAEIDDVLGCFRSGPIDDKRRNVVERPSTTTCRVTSYTSRTAALGDLVTNAVVLKLKAGPRARLTAKIAKPAQVTVTKRLSDLATSGHIEITGPFSSESFMLHRLVFAPRYRGALTHTDKPDGKGTDWYYARVAQANGDQAWSSPIWVEA